MKIQDSTVRSLAEQYMNGQIADWTVLMENDGKVICRVPFDTYGSVILKLWPNQGLRSWIRYRTNSRPIDRELKVLQHLDDSPVRVPKLLGNCWIDNPRTPFSQAVVLEDLGQTQRVLESYRKFRYEDRYDDVKRLEYQMIEMTEHLLNFGVVDPDHGLVNSVLTPSGELVRIDFEVAKIVPSARIATKQCGEMIGRTLVTFAYAAQPDVDALDRFASQLIQRLWLPKKAVKYANRFVQSALADQRNQVGIDLRWQLAV